MKQMFQGRGFLARDQEWCSIGRYQASFRWVTPRGIAAAASWAEACSRRDSQEQHNQALAPVAKKNKQIAHTNGAIVVKICDAIIAVDAWSPRGEQN